MGTKKYAIGIDYGTESGRAVLVDVADGSIVAMAVHPYANGVIDETLPETGQRLEPDWALQDPNDYLEVLKRAVPAVLQESGVDPADVIGVGVDFTACTVVAAKADGTPLCFLPEWRANPHAWVKLWKHHAAQPEANRLNEIARERKEPWLDRYGGKISSEWFFPKVWQTLDEAPEVYAAADRFIEGADWIIWQMTGNETRNSCTAGYKAIWSASDGFPSKDFLEALDPRLENVVDEKMSHTIQYLGDKAGGLTETAAAWTGLSWHRRRRRECRCPRLRSTATVTERGDHGRHHGYVNCHLVLSKVEHTVLGCAGYVAGGIIPGYFGYEAGQSCVGVLRLVCRELRLRLLCSRGCR